MPNWLPEDPPWLRPAGRLFWAIVVMFIMVGPIITGVTGKPKIVVRHFPALRYKSEDGATWAGAMFGAVWVFGLMLVVYAIIPHEFIGFCDKYLQWGNDKFLFRSNQDMFNQGIHTWPFSFNYQALRDILVTMIYGFFITVNVVLMAMWQKRPTSPEAEEDSEPVAVGTSSFGRPVKAKA